MFCLGSTRTVTGEIQQKCKLLQSGQVLNFSSSSQIHVRVGFGVVTHFCLTSYISLPVLLVFIHIKCLSVIEVNK